MLLFYSLNVLVYMYVATVCAHVIKNGEDRERRRGIRVQLGRGFRVFFQYLNGLSSLQKIVLVSEFSTVCS